MSAHLEDELLKKSPFTLINCIKLFIFPSRSTCRTVCSVYVCEKRTKNQVEKSAKETV